MVFEVQFHTRASLEAKELTHKAYERIRSITGQTPETDRETAEIRDFQRQVNAKVPIPPGVTEYEDYRPEDVMADEISYYAIVSDFSSRR